MKNDEDHITVRIRRTAKKELVDLTKPAYDDSFADVVDKFIEMYKEKCNNA